MRIAGRRADRPIVEPRRGNLDICNLFSTLDKTMRFGFVLILSVLCIQAGVAQKLVDPDKVAPEFRAAAEKRRAEQIKQIDCGHKADEAKVLPRDRINFLQQCLNE
jgi:hypothetical protein